MQYRLSLLRATFNASLDGILVVDHETSKVRDYNDRFLEMWGIPSAVALEKNDEKLLQFVLAQLIEPEQFLQLVHDLYANPERKSFDTLQFKDGRFFDRYSEALMMEGKICGRVWFFRDVTAQKEAQRALLQSAKMSSLGEMASGIAHEINNPLTIIHSVANQLRNQINKGEFDTLSMHNQLEKIENTTQRIAKIVKGLKAFSRNSEADPMQITRLSQIVEDTLELCQERFRTHGVDLRISVDAALFLKCRPSQISQILMNLLSNSYDAISALPVKWIELKTEVEGRTVLVSVTDSGKGIGADVQEKIMQPFFTTKDVGGGTGLGLSIAKGIAEEHEGELYYDASSVHTRFILKLPLQQVSGKLQSLWPHSPSSL